MNPRDAKAALARAIVRQFHGGEAAQAAEQRFRAVVGGGGVPTDAPAVPTQLGDRDAFELVREVVVALGQTQSNKELRRLFAQGGIAVAPPGAGGWTPLAADDRPEIAEGTVLKVGKRTHARLVSA